MRCQMIDRVIHVINEHTALCKNKGDQFFFIDFLNKGIKNLVLENGVSNVNKFKNRRSKLYLSLIYFNHLYIIFIH